MAVKLRVQELNRASLVTLAFVYVVTAQILSVVFRVDNGLSDHSAEHVSREHHFVV
jgi:hypothetical protein